MILFFQSPTKTVLAVEAAHAFSPEDVEKLVWAFSEAKPLQAETLEGWYVGPRREMITPWSTNAVEITQNMGLTGISRIEEYFPVSSGEAEHDPMLQRIYDGLNQDIFTISKQPDPIVYIEDIEAYNKQEGLALSDEEVAYLNEVSQKLERRLTDSEVYGFAQVNSEHCRHKIFGGTFIIDGEEKESSLFNLIKKTSAENPNKLVSAYKDNVAFNEGPVIEQFAPASGDKPDFYEVKEIKSVISLKAETHNFPTTVEPFNGAATGSGGEIRDRLGGGKSSLPIAGTAVYMTSYPRTEGAREWEKILDPRPCLWAFLVIIVQVMDYVTPMLGTKYSGGGKWGNRGCMIGTIAGLFVFPPWGVLIGPFAGAVIGELFGGKKSAEAFKAGLGAFVGFLFSVVVKVSVCGYFIYSFVAALF